MRKLKPNRTKLVTLFAVVERGVTVDFQVQLHTRPAREVAVETAATLELVLRDAFHRGWGVSLEEVDARLPFVGPDHLVPRPPAPPDDDSGGSYNLAAPAAPAEG